MSNPFPVKFFNLLERKFVDCWIFLIYFFPAACLILQIKNYFIQTFLFRIFNFTTGLKLKVAFNLEPSEVVFTGLQKTGLLKPVFLWYLNLKPKIPRPVVLLGDALLHLTFPQIMLRQLCTSLLIVANSRRSTHTAPISESDGHVM